ncbi:hypothetical protein [Dechloromonas sp. A34]|uniref:hypothetical protein n=1 Tax=Dechloromonas sp. A34 TaxID=447588 RepID=UPI003A5233AC
MDGLEDFALQTSQIAGDVQRVIEAGDVGPGRPAKGDRHLLEDDVGRQLGGPGDDQRIELGAVRATVAEEFQNFDLPGILGRLHRRDRRVILAGRLGERRQGDGQGTAHGGT